jgi:parallel beta-helix repeat protein
MMNLNSSPMVTNCSFLGNVDTGFGEGGGMRNISSASPTVVNCTFSGNDAPNQGGGIASVQGSSPTFVNCTFSDNSSNQGGGVWTSDGTTSLVNCVLHGNTPTQIHDGRGGSTTVSFSNVQAGWPGQGNINAEPLFVDPLGVDGVPGTDDDDLRLLPGSPCIDVGNNTAVPVGITTDLDGNPRFVDDPNTPDCQQAPGQCGDPPVVDMGAYEFQGTSCPWDCADDDGEVGILDFLALLAEWDMVDTPCDFNGDGVGITDFLLLLSQWGPCP